VPQVGDIFKGKDVGMTGSYYIMVACPCCPEGENTRLAPYNKGNPLQSTTVRLCGPHRKSKAGSTFNP
jgi:hypothetical protein